MLLTFFWEANLHAGDNVIFRTMDQVRFTLMALESMHCKADIKYDGFIQETANKEYN